MQLTYTVFLTIVFLIYVLFLQEVGQDDLKWAHFIQQRLKSGQATLKVFNKSRPPSTFSSLENTGSMGSMDNMDNRDNMDNMDNMDNEVGRRWERSLLLHLVIADAHVPVLLLCNFCC